MVLSTHVSPIRALDLTAGCLFRLVSQSGPELQANSVFFVLFCTPSLRKGK